MAPTDGNRPVAILLAAVVAVLVALAVPGLAGAWAPPPASDEARLAAYLPIARAAWPGSPCAGVEDVQVVAFLPGGAVGEQDPGTCRVRLLAGRTAEQLCSTLVHELGHAAGYGHTDDPAAVHAPPGRWAYIRSSTSATWPACVAATTPTARYMAEKYVREQLPAQRRWRVTCTPMGGRPTCRARRPGARDRRFAIMVHKGEVFAADPL